MEEKKRKIVLVDLHDRERLTLGLAATILSRIAGTLPAGCQEREELEAAQTTCLAMGATDALEVEDG